MNEDTLWFIGILLIFAIILLLEWRYRSRSLRVVAAVMALVMLWFSQPSNHAAWRRAISTPPTERVMHWNECLDLGECQSGTPDPVSDSLGRSLSEYESGVFTMYRAIITGTRAYTNERLVMLGILFWLACSPAFQRTPGQAHEPTAEGGPRIVVPDQ